MNQELLRAVLDLANLGQPKRPLEQQVVVRIPKTHPKAAAIAKLARSLATREEYASGFVRERIAQPGAFDEFMDALKELGIDTDRIRAAINVPAPDPLDPRHFISIAQHASKILPALQGMAREQAGRR